MDEILFNVAEMYGVSVQTVEHEIEYAISQAILCGKSDFWERLSPKGETPDIESVIAEIVHLIC